MNGKRTDVLYGSLGLIILKTLEAPGEAHRSALRQFGGVTQQSKPTATSAASRSSPRCVRTSSTPCGR